MHRLKQLRDLVKADMATYALAYFASFILSSQEKTRNAERREKQDMLQGCVTIRVEEKLANLLTFCTLSIFSCTLP